LKPLRPSYPLRTERLELRPFEPEDIDALFAMESRADVARYLYNEPWTRAEAEEHLERYRAALALEEEGEFLDLAMVLRSTGDVVGKSFLAWRSTEHRLAEVGYGVHPDRQGQGYATEATRVIFELAFDGLGAHRVIGRLDARNVASARVLEHLGMRLEAHLVENEWVKGEWASELVYALLESEYRAAATRPPARPGTAP
jgi:RimJ/RimL family protein N-acetyltransferase